MKVEIVVMVDDKELRRFNIDDYQQCGGLLDLMDEIETTLLYLF